VIFSTTKNVYLDKLLTLKLNQKIAIVGLGVENMQFLIWLVDVLKFDTNRILVADKNSVGLSVELPDTNIFSGENYLDVLKGNDVEMVFKAPGIWSLKPEFVAFRHAHGHDSVLSSLVFFFEKYREQIVAITGTKGKSTTCSLSNALINSLPGKTSNYCGNTTNISPYSYWKTLHQAIKASEYFVIEASSFQLQDLGYSGISPKYAAITNLYVDHQDQHATPSEYWQAKENIFLFQETGDYLVTTGEVLDVSQKARNKISLAVSMDYASHIYGLFETDLMGDHNKLNLTLALCLACKIGNISEPEDYQINFQHILSNFKKLPHRLEFVRSFETEIMLKTKTLDKNIELKINFFDDGAATEPDAVIAALDTLSERQNKYVWLQLAGVDKGAVLDKLADKILKIQQNSKLFQVSYCGQIGQRILSKIYSKMGANITPEMELFRPHIEEQFGSLKDIANTFQGWFCEVIRDLEEVGESSKVSNLSNGKVELNIVLSPCGTSFDEFKNYDERGNWWKEKVMGLD
jgi:UDP-N-acetylmuramoylalanine-D-glutamate ligase